MQWQALLRKCLWKHESSLQQNAPADKQKGKWHMKKRTSIILWTWFGAEMSFCVKRLAENSSELEKLAVF